MSLFSLFQENRGYIFSVYLAVIPVFFVWHTELVFDYTGTDLTNGFMTFDGLQIYHLLLYMMFTGNFIASIYVAKSLEDS